MNTSKYEAYEHQTSLADSHIMHLKQKLKVITNRVSPFLLSSKINTEITKCLGLFFKNLNNVCKN